MHTPGPWKVFEMRHPHYNGAEHVERCIGTAWEHAQLKGPFPVVSLAVGIGQEPDSVYHFIAISEDDARLIAEAPTLHECAQRVVDTHVLRFGEPIIDPLIAELAASLARASVVVRR